MTLFEIREMAEGPTCFRNALCVRRNSGGIKPINLFVLEIWEIQCEIHTVERNRDLFHPLDLRAHHVHLLT